MLVVLLVFKKAPRHNRTTHPHIFLGWNEFGMAEGKISSGFFSGSDRTEERGSFFELKKGEGRGRGGSGQREGRKRKHIIFFWDACVTAKIEGREGDSQHPGQEEELRAPASLEVEGDLELRSRRLR